MTISVDRTISRMHSGLVDGMIEAIEKDLACNLADTESRRNNLEMLAALKTRRAGLDFQARQTTMFDDFFQLEAK